MNQPAKEQQKCTKQNKTGKWLSRKKQAVGAVIFALIAVVVVPVLAWLYYQRSMQTITKINEPYALRIGAGYTQDIEQLELSNIDVSGDEKKKDVVFCVYSVHPEVQFHLQLAHTTNIGFTYTIYPASKVESGGIPYLGNNYLCGSTSIPGSYLNIDDNTHHATNTYHGLTYGNYGYVQDYAEPLYWKTAEELSLPSAPDDSTGYYINYYVLRISWDNTVQNNKETDMVYLMAEATGNGDTDT